jgi:F-type H+-transporting ATPase subunit c
MGNLDTKTLIYAFSVIGAAMAVLTGLGAGIFTAKATEKAVDAVSRQPEAAGDITRTLIVGCAFSEATAVYGLLVAILLVVVKIC